jgi:hypothetical protein
MFYGRAVNKDFRRIFFRKPYRVFMMITEQDSLDQIFCAVDSMT